MGWKFREWRKRSLKGKAQTWGCLGQLSAVQYISYDLDIYQKAFALGQRGHDLLTAQNTYRS